MVLAQSGFSGRIFWGHHMTSTRVSARRTTPEHCRRPQKRRNEANVFSQPILNPAQLQTPWPPLRSSTAAGDSQTPARRQIGCTGSCSNSIPGAREKERTLTRKGEAGAIFVVIAILFNAELGVRLTIARLTRIWRWTFPVFPARALHGFTGLLAPKKDTWTLTTLSSVVLVVLLFHLVFLIWEDLQGPAQLPPARIELWTYSMIT